MKPERRLVLDFIQQNPLACEDLTVSEIETFAEHYAGGLVVLAGYPMRENFYVKLHDSWSDTTDIVVHEYHLEDPDQQTERYFTDSRRAFEYFMHAITGQGLDGTGPSTEGES
jgi:hypothetical protein